LAAISAEFLCRRFLVIALAGGQPDRREIAELAELCAGWNAEVDSRTLFRDLVEPLSDRFDPALVPAYNHIFGHLVEALTGLDAGSILERYERIRQVRAYSGDPHRVVVLSRVTLGADIAVTSVLVDAAKRAFPRAEIVFAGPPKNLQLFAGDGRVRGETLPYGRSASLPGRLQTREPLAALCAPPGTLVLDPDSRMSQLGLLPAGDPDHYLLFESRAYGGDRTEPLSQLASEWAARTLGVEGARPYLPVEPATVPPGTITASLGTGGNDAKQPPPEFERAVLRLLRMRARGLLIVDLGAGGDEGERVKAAADGLTVDLFEGPFTGFAERIASSQMYFGYDSAGQHAAAALGIPLVTVFQGFVNERFLQRWTPAGAGLVRVVRADRPGLLRRTADTVNQLFAS
jgi:hypothetical protein